MSDDNTMLLKKSVVMMDFFETQSQEMRRLLQSCNDTLQMQIYSSTMNENLVNDLLDLAKLDNGKFSLHYEPFNLVQTIKAAFNTVGEIAAHQNISLAAVIDDLNHLGLMQSIVGDDRRYSQILLNFLSNSLKFTKSGGEVTMLIRVVGVQE